MPEQEAAEEQGAALKLPLRKPKYVHVMYRKNGQKVCYYRRPGCVAVPLPITIGSREFNEAYREAVAATALLVKRSRNTTLHPLSHRHLSEAVIKTMAESGVYLLIDKGKVVYVGTSQDCGARIAKQRQNGRRFEQAFYIFAEESQREWLERLLIRQLDPEGNRRGRVPRTRGAPSASRL